MHWVFFSIILFSLGGCVEHEVGGKTAEDVFEDKTVVALAKASCAGRLDEMNTLFDRGVDADATGFSNITPLIWAMTCENEKGIETLLINVANPNHRTSGGATPVTLATTYRNNNILQLLITHGGDINAVDTSTDQTALVSAFATGVEQGLWDNYYFLLEQGADIDKPNSVKGTIADFAAAMGQFSKVEELLNRGYDYDLLSLTRTVLARFISPETSQGQAKERVLAILKERGIDIAAEQERYENL